MLQSHVLPRLTWFAILYLLHQVPCHLNLFCFPAASLDLVVVSVASNVAQSQSFL